MFTFSSTSPLNHKPLATFFVLVVNLALGLATLGMSQDTVDSLTLSYTVSSGKPLTWITSPFIHTSMIHLVGNLVFLGLFCAFIEGKLGSGPFIAVLVAVCFVSSMGEQTLMTGQLFKMKKRRTGNFKQYSSTTSKTGVTKSPTASTTPGTGTAASGTKTGINDNLTMTAEEAEARFNKRRRSLGGKMQFSGSVGASTAIFGLLAVCLAWSPGSSFRIGDPSKPLVLPMLIVVGGYVIWEIAKWVLAGFEKGGLPIHLVGLVPGFVIGVACVKLNLVSVDGAFQQSDLDVVPVAVPEKPTETPAERRAKAKELRRAQREAAREKQKLFVEAAAVVSTPTKKVTRRVRVDSAIQEAQRALGSGNPVDAVKILDGITDEDVLEQLPLSDYVNLIQELTERRHWAAVIVALKKSILGHPDDATERQLKLARLYMGMKDFAACETALASIKRKSLTPEQDREFKQFVVKIRQSRD